jgi:hypothetical protein
MVAIEVSTAYLLLLVADRFICSNIVYTYNPVRCLCSLSDSDLRKSSKLSKWSNYYTKTEHKDFDV